MEKSQWDLKKVRLMSRRFSRMDDFVSIYKGSMDALLREYADSLKRKRKQKVICYFYLNTYVHTQSLTHSHSQTNFSGRGMGVLMVSYHCRCLHIKYIRVHFP
jgi:hypothetical protein